MKKISAVFAILFALSISVFFGGCEGKYDKLKISYDSDTSYVQLILDDEYWNSMGALEEDRENKNAKTVKVTFDGIKKKYIGDLDIKVVPSDLAEIKENEVIEKTLHFNIYASRPGIGEIQVTHLSSGKSIAIPLYVDKKANGASGNGNGIVLNFPTPNEDGSHKEYVYTINPNSVLQYSPFDATDNVSWSIVGATQNNIEIGTFDEVDENSPKTPTQIKISSENAVEETFYITPTLTVDDYEDIQLADVKVPVSVVKVVDENNLRLLSSNAITTATETEQIGNTTYKVINEPIYLFHNSLQFGNAKLYLYANEQTNVLQSSDYMRFYECSEIKKSSSLIDVKINNVENCIDVVGLGYNENLQWFEITFTPKNCVGDIKSFTVRQEISLTEVAERIAVNLDGESLTTTDVNESTATVDVDLLDYYTNNLGQKFNFSVYKTTTHTSLKKYMRIIVDPSLLFSNAAEHNGDGNYGTLVGSNIYLLQFKIGSNDLKFNIKPDGYAYSDLFTSTSNLYAKYVYNSNGSGIDELNFSVRNEYDGSLGEDVLLNSSRKELVISISRGRGIKSMSLHGAYVVGNKDSNKHDYNNNGENSMFVLNSAIADNSSFTLENSKYVINADTYVYGIEIGNIEGATAISSEEINNIDFKYTVYQNGKEVDLFNFAIFSSSENSITFLESSTFNLVGQTIEGVNILLVLKKDGVIVPNEEFIIEISEPISGYKNSFNYSVVTNVTAENADVTPFNSSDINTYKNIYTGTQYRNYLFDVLDDEFIETLTEEQILSLQKYLKNVYIVPTNQSIDTTIRLGAYNDSNFITDNSYAPYISDISLSTQRVSLSYNKDTFEFEEMETDVLPSLNYIKNNSNDLVGDFKFDINLKTGEYGTIYNKEKYFIKVNYYLYSDKYELKNNFYEITGKNEPAVVTYYFFIYVDLGETKFEQDASIINTYFYEDLGYYFQNEGRNTIQISLPNKYGKSQSVFDYVDYRWDIALDDLADFNYTTNKEDHSLTFTLIKPEINPSYRDRTIKATITQFGVKRTIACTVHVNEVKITTSLVVRNPLNYLDATQNYYVYLKEGGDFQFDIEQIGNPTFAGVKYVVCDLAGNVSKDYKIDDFGKLVKMNTETTTITDLKVLIFATDWVTKNLESEINVFDFNNLDEYTFVKNGVNYSNRVKVIDVKIRNGSKANPYLLANAKDFNDINKDLNAYYEVVNDINLNGEVVSIQTFNGNLSSYRDYKVLSSRPSNWANNYKNYYTYSSKNGFEPISGDTAPAFVYRKFYELNQNVYTVYNISFNSNSGFNLIDEISLNAEISNINFKYSFNNAYSNVGYIGLIAKNYGTLKNVKVEYLGNLTLNSDTSSSVVYIGMLAAVNYGSIIYDNASTAYSSGKITITDNTSKEVYVGGLVGKNTPATLNVEETEITTPANISGVLLSSDNETIEYALYYENQGSLFDGDIIFNSSNNKGALGGLVGYNNGIIKDVFTSGKLKGYNNVGGLIGKNVYTILDSLATSKNANVINCLSITQIVGNNYIGGITGHDENGGYYHVYYEVYNNKDAITDSAYAIQGKNYVGGLLGRAKLSQLNYCYFHSFRWDYKFEDPYVNNEFIFEESEFANNFNLPDIKATYYVGGLIGYADSENRNYSNNETVEISTTKATYIINSVADAYISASNYLGGLIGYAYGYPVAINVYAQGSFIAIENHSYKDVNVYVDNVMQSNSCKTNYYTNVFGKVYNEINDTYSIKHITENGVIETSSSSLFKKFVKDTINNVNNGNYYVEFNDKPLITQAPTGIDLDKALITIENRSTNLFNSNNIDDAAIISDKILIYYFNLINNNQLNYSNDSVSVNIINLDDIVEKAKIKITPEGIGARIKVTSSNEKVITISSSGYIKLIGEGESVLTFASLINPNVYDTITVIVRAKPSDYNIYKNSSKNEDLNNSSISIVKGESKFIYEDYVGKTFVNGTEYLYNTTNDVAVFAKISNKDGKILINGKVYDTENETYEFEHKQPIIISVKEYSEDSYTITMTSYVKLELGEDVYYVKVIEEERSFEIITKRGITKINTNITDAVMSVADSLNVDLSIQTDTDTNNVNISVEVRDEQGNVSKVYDNYGKEIDVNNLFTYNFENKTNFEIGTNGLNGFVLQLNQNARIEKDLFATITFSAGNVKSEMFITLIPQKISSIVANAYKLDGGSWKLSEVVRPDEAGIIVINVAPDTAYYEYLEITDTYSSERISFIQWSEFDADVNGFGNGKALNEIDKPSSDGFGIKLVKTEDKTLYVHTLLSLFATNNDAHRILITAYSSSGYILGSSYIDLEAMMFPSVILSYYNENDEIEIYADSREASSNNDTDLAVGVQAKIGVETNNADSSIPKWEITDEKGNSLSHLLGIELSQNGYWYLTYNQNITNAQIEGLIGSTIILKATVQQVTKGFIEIGVAELKFNLKRFTLNGITAQTGRETSGNRLGGIINEETFIEFYFNNTHNRDVSYYQNGEYFNKNYFVDFNENSDKVNNILKEVNNFNNSGNATIKLVNNQNKNDVINISEKLKDKTEYIHTVGDVQLFKITKNNNELTKIIIYSNSMNNYSLEISIKYHYDSTGNVILGDDANNKIETLVLTTRYGLNFVTNSSPKDYYPIKNSEEFMNMVQGQYYILYNDITLTNYKMLDINLGGFDGNGHTITIESFDYDSLSGKANGTVGYLGLFKQIYAGEIIENLIVNYKYGVYPYDLSTHLASDNTDYTSFYFGGLAAINAGIITNCEVIGRVNLTTSKISPANFYLGGLVAENYTTGYITNSSIKLTIEAGGIIGGVVTTNQGKIASTNFVGTVKAYTSTNTSLSNEINAAMFVVTNSGEISMCYVSPMLKNGEDVEGTGIINSGGSLGGFAYSNSGKIYDCYLKDIKFSSRGYMGGFVYASTGTIERCYVDSASSLQGNRYSDIFVYDKTTGTFKDCFYILTEKFNSSVQGIKCITELDMLKENHYTNFAFSTNGSNVWLMTSNGPILPKCGASQYVKNITIKVQNGVENIEYSILGTKENPYIIYDLESFNYWFNLNEDGIIYGYFRFVADIDFALYKNIPVSSKYVFSGSIEGNNMIISNFSIFTNKEEEQNNSIGLFKEIRHTSKNNFVANLILNCESVRASTTASVGVLAGIIDGGNVYSVNIDNEKLVVLGKNAVGGLAGTIKGDYNIENIISNVSANASYRQNLMSKLNIYYGRYNSGSEENNIEQVSYAGSIAGIVEGYDYRINSSVTINNYYAIRNCKVIGNVTLIGETVGGAFGFISERSRISNVTFEVGEMSTFKGIYYSGGLVGENRGIIDNSQVIADSSYINLFDVDLTGSYASVNGGITAVNYGGLIYNCVNNVNVVNMYTLSTTGGIAGRNVGGSVNNCVNNGMIFGFFAGNIVASDYSYKTILNAGNSSGTITSNTIEALNRTVDYSKMIFADNAKISNGYVVTLESLDNWFTLQTANISLINKSMSDFYTYDKNIDPVYLSFSRVLGAVIGITDKELTYSTTTINNENSEEITVIQLKDGENVFIEVENSEEDLNFVSTSKDLGENGNKYSALQNAIKNDEVTYYYYFVSVTTKTYDFHNLTADGYNDSYARIVR